MQSSATMSTPALDTTHISIFTTELCCSMSLTIFTIVVVLPVPGGPWMRVIRFFHDIFMAFICLALVVFFICNFSSHSSKLSSEKIISGSSYCYSFFTSLMISWKNLICLHTLSDFILWTALCILKMTHLRWTPDSTWFWCSWTNRSKISTSLFNLDGRSILLTFSLRVKSSSRPSLQIGVTSAPAESWNSC